MSPYGKYAMLFGLCATAPGAFFTMTTFRGVVSAPSAERPPPLSLRSASTGWRQYHFWHSGFSGGK